MNVDQAAINMSNVLQDSRIETPKGPLTSREHQQLAADLHLLISRAKEVDEATEEAKRLVIKVANLEGELIALREDLKQARIKVHEVIKNAGAEVPGEFLSEEEEKELLKEIKGAPDPGPMEAPKE